MRSVVALVSSREHFVLVMTFLVVTYWDCASVDIGEKLSRIPDILWSVGPQCPAPDTQVVQQVWSTVQPQYHHNTGHKRGNYPELSTFTTNQDIHLRIIYYSNKYLLWIVITSITL